MAMHYAGWILSGTWDDGERERIVTEIAALVCEHYNLCASLGCACLTGVGDTVCHEYTIGEHHPLAYCEGPTWSVLAVSLEQTIRIELHTSAPVAGEESNALYDALRRYGKSLFLLQGSGGVGF